MRRRKERRKVRSYHRPVTRIEVLRPFVRETVAAYLGLPEDQLQEWEDGTIPIRAGSTAISVRLIEGNDGHPLLQVFARVLGGVKQTPELLLKLNELNSTFSFVRAFATGDEVLVAMELLAEELDAAQIRHACSVVSWAGDHWDGELKAKFGGDTAFPEKGYAARIGAQSSAPTPASPEGPPGEDPPPAGYI